ncbi:MAG: type II toxin-antitoxin system HicB family antitoxin [Burkholderiaceae bacterium]
MNQLEYKGYIGSQEMDVSEGILHGKLLFITDVVTYEAKTVPELLINFKHAIDNYLNLCSELGDLPNTPFKGSFNVRIGPELHRSCAIQANLENISLNDWVRKACESSLSDDLVKTNQKTERLADIIMESVEENFQFVQNEANGAGNICQTIQLH